MKIIDSVGIAVIASSIARPVCWQKALNALLCLSIISDFAAVFFLVLYSIAKGLFVDYYGFCRVLFADGDVSQILDYFPAFVGKVEGDEVIYIRSHFRIGVCKHIQRAGNGVFSAGYAFCRRQNSIHRKGLHCVVHKAQANVSNCIFSAVYAGAGMPV